MTNGATTSTPSPQVMTRSQAEAEATAAHRARYLSKLTPKIVWFVIPLVAAAINICLLIIEEPTFGGYLLGFLGLCLCAFSALIFYRKDRQIRAIASLTPIYDIEAARAQISVLESAVQLLGEACRFNEPDMTKRSVSVVYSALAPLLARGPTSLETATAAGYPPYPEVDVTPMPGVASDFVSIHLLRLEACASKIRKIADLNPGELIFAETVSLLAGEFIPPLRAIEAQTPLPTATA